MAPWEGARQEREVSGLLKRGNTGRGLVKRKRLLPQNWVLREAKLGPKEKQNWDLKRGNIGIKRGNIGIKRGSKVGLEFIIFCALEKNSYN